MIADRWHFHAVYPAAPPGQPPPNMTLSMLYVAMAHNSYKRHRSAYIIGLVISTLVAIASLVTSGPMALMWAIFALLFVWVIVAAVVLHSARKRFLEIFATSRGLRVAGTSGAGSGVPLLRQGSDHRVLARVSGPIGPISDAELVSYQYTTGSGDDTTYHHYSLIIMQLPPAVAARYQGVFSRPRTISFGALQDAIASDRGVRFESVDLDSSYAIRALDSQDDIALYELFHPAFLDTLVQHGRLHWEQCGSELVVFRAGQPDSFAEMDELAQRACIIVERYLEEHR